MKLLAAAAILAGATTVLLASACGSPTPTATAEPVPTDSFVQQGPTTPTPSATTDVTLNARFGQTYAVTVPEYDRPTQTYTLTVSQSATSTTPISTYGSAPHNGYFVTFKVAIQATSDGPDYNAGYFYVRDAAGVHYDPSAAVGDPGGLGSGTLHVGEKVAGLLAADVPTPHGTLVYQPIGATGSSVIEWAF